VTEFDIQYAAHTATCTFLLDSEGICRRIVMVPGAATGSPRGRETARAASRCIGAQYVASLDAAAPGLLTDMPKIGTSMLFARTDDRGKISLVRTGHVTRFERHTEDPFTQPEDRPSVVATSAPPLSPSLAPTPRRQPMLPPPDPYNDAERLDDRTKPVQALRQSDIRALRRPPPSTAPMSEPPTLRTPHVGPPPRRSDVAPKPGAVEKPALVRRR
jgi:hypothetical protein